MFLLPSVAVMEQGSRFGGRGPAYTHVKKCLFEQINVLRKEKNGKNVFAHVLALCSMVA